MWNNPGGKPLLSKAWLAAILAAWPVWAALYMTNRPEINPLWPVQVPATFLLLVLIYPTLEEIAFRGFIQGELMRSNLLRQTFMGLTLANIITSIIFSAAHVLTHPPAMAALVLLPSLAFGYFRDRHDGWLLPAILLHVYYNLGYFLIFKPVI